MTNEMLSGYAVGLSLMNSYDIDSYYLYCKGCLAKNTCGNIVGSISSENNLSSFEARSNCLDVQVYGDNNYKIELNLNEDSIEVNEYTSGQLTSTVKLFK